MTVKCFVSLPDEVIPKTYKFVTLPRAGEEITLPGHLGEFIVELISHFPQKSRNSPRPTVQIHLRALTPKEVHHRPIGFLVH